MEDDCDKLLDLNLEFDHVDGYSAMDLNLECDDDGNYDLPSVNNDINIFPTSLVSNNASLLISFISEATPKQEVKKDRNFHCGVCLEKFKIETKYREHMLGLHQCKKPFNCQHCSYTASCSKLITKHTKRRHAAEDEVISSSHAQEVKNSFTVEENNDSDSHEVSQRSHAPEQSKEHQVDNSLKTIQVHPNRIAKERTQDKDEAKDRLLKCDQCKLTFKQKKGFDYHKKKHLEKYNFPCNLCEKKFVSNTSLKRHMKTHQPSRPYVCNFSDCRKSFKIKSTLSDHKRYVHGQSQLIANDDPLSCKSEIPNKTGRLREKKIQCNFEGCSKYFRDSFNLRVHMDTHLGRKSLKCTKCHFTCTQQNSMNWHLKKSHSGGQK